MAPYFSMDETLCLKSQKEELEVLEVCLIVDLPKVFILKESQSIYPDIITSKSILTIASLRLEIPIELGASRLAKIIDEDILSTKPPELLSISTLPTILIHIVLPPTYPALAPPTFVALLSTFSWLVRRSFLEEKLLSMWQPGEPVLYTWVAYLRNADFLDDMMLVDPSDNTIRSEQVSFQNTN